jgi:hypothetical protein
MKETIIEKLNNNLKKTKEYRYFQESEKVFFLKFFNGSSIDEQRNIHYIFFVNIVEGIIGDKDENGIYPIYIKNGDSFDTIIETYECFIDNYQSDYLYKLKIILEKVFNENHSFDISFFKNYSKYDIDIALKKMASQFPELFI